MRPRILLLAVTAMLTCAVAACSSKDSAADATGSSTTSHNDTESNSDVFPTGNWETIDAAQAGLDPLVLDELNQRAEAAGSNCVAVIRNGRLVDEQYWNGATADTPQEIFSASKSVTNVLMGLAEADGAFEVTDPASKYIPQWQGTPSDTVTIENLLSNDSGRHQDLATDYGRMAAQAVDKTAFAVGLGQDVAPGNRWVYNNSAIQSLEEVFQNATGKDMAEFASQRLFEPIGMADSSIARDRAGNPMTFMGTQSTCRDMARFGYLMLHDGNWDGKQIVPAKWVHDSTGQPSQDLNAAYGWLWWLNRKGPVLGALQASGGASGTATSSQLVPDAPENMFFAMGLGGQIVAIDPGSDTVVVRLGPSGTPDGTPKFGAEDAAVVAERGVVGP